MRARARSLARAPACLHHTRGRNLWSCKFVLADSYLLSLGCWLPLLSLWHRTVLKGSTFCVPMN
eukprot:6197015-Pleurochrysis_carterae.AAC.1